MNAALPTAEPQPLHRQHPPTMNADLSKLALALEYVDMAAGLYTEGGSDHAARLLAAAAEKLLGDLGRLMASRPSQDEVQSLLVEVALRYEAPEQLPRSHLSTRNRQPTLDRVNQSGGLMDNEARSITSTLLRACWYQIESLGLEAVAPERLQEAIELSTIYGTE